MTVLDHRTVRPADADVIIIGAGLNGLVCGLSLAQARLRVLILEASARPGGFCAAKEIVPGFRVPMFAHWNGPLDSALIKTLKQLRLAVDVVQPRLGTIALSPDGNHIVLDSHARRGTGGLTQHSATDAKTWGPFDAAMRKLASGLGAGLIDTPLKSSAKGGAPPRVKQDDTGKAALSGLALRSIASLAEEYFEAPRLQGALALDAVMATGMGPRTPGSALSWIERLAVETQRPDAACWVQGGPSAVIHALSQAIQAVGANLRFNAQAARLIAKRGRVEGVALADGESLFAPIVVSSLGAQEVFQWPSSRQAGPLGGEEHLEAGPPPHGLAKVHLALRGLPQFKGLDSRDMRARMLIADSLDAVEQAYDAATSGQLPASSPMEVVIPTTSDATLAPKDCHILSAVVPFAPLAPAQGWREASNALILQAIDVLGRFAPDLPNRVLSAEAETPDTMAAAAPIAQSLWRRPSAGPLHNSNPYGCSVSGLYFCGVGTQPRLGASGLNGRNCAEAILALDPYAGQIML